ncbi:transcriptional regulator [Paenibacillus polymyxa]|uniref:tetratricopeptide repeat protein n=1 Tax=Paenibacillus polymyxa TaxID=1406 RepID=UPI002AB5C578|nr:transcriptional regulator [Paenibacillus polymyxa]MDY8022320.1 transcriptional regulator [Paenibacillus polymyxa]
MKQNELNITQFGLVAGINPGTVSGIVTGNRTLSVQQLDRITATLGHPKGHFYKNYIEEFLSATTPNIRRVRPLFYHCAELNMLDCIEQVVNLLMEKLAYADALFTIAEDFFQQGKFAASIILYESVAVGEKKQHSERLALCQYRIFMAKQGDDQEINYQAAIQFEDYVERLDDADQLDALKDLVNTYRSLRKWSKVNVFAKIMGDKATIQCEINQQIMLKRWKKKKNPVNPPFVYWAYSYLLRAGVCEAQKDYSQALEYTYTYADLSWVEETDEETLLWKGRFTEWAQANTYVNKLLAGDIGVLPDYLAYVTSKKNEVLPALVNIIEAANQYLFNVDDVLKRFELEILSLTEQQKSVGVYTQQLITESFARFLKGLADYYLRKERYQEGFKYLISSLEISSTIKTSSKASIIKCVELFERFKKNASSGTINTYQNLINKVYEIEKS